MNKPWQPLFKQAFIKFLSVYMESKWTGHHCLVLVYNQLVSAILGILCLWGDMKLLNVFSYSWTELKEILSNCQDATLPYVVDDCRLTGGGNIDPLSVSVKPPFACLSSFLSKQVFVPFIFISCDVWDQVTKITLLMFAAQTQL